MKISAGGLGLIKRSEGYRDEVYKDQAGLDTIGYGHLLTAQDKESGRFECRRITKKEATDLLIKDVEDAENAVNSLVEVELTQNQFDVLVDFVFNLGKRSLARSTLLMKLNAGEYDQVPRQLMRWTKVRDPLTGKLSEYAGLVRRRRREALMWTRAEVTE